MEPGFNLRECTRVHVNVVTELRWGGKVSISGRLRDISLSGVFIDCDAKLPLGTNCEIALILDGGGGQEYIHAECTITRADDHGLALQFASVLGDESLSHLRNLVLYNSGTQTDQVEQEISDHLGIK